MDSTWRDLNSLFHMNWSICKFPASSYERKQRKSYGFVKNLKDRIIELYVNAVLSFGGKNSYQGPLLKLQFTSRNRPFHLWQLQAVKLTHMVLHINAVCVWIRWWKIIKLTCCTCWKEWVVYYVCLLMMWFMSPGLSPETLKFKNGLCVFEQCEVNSASDAIVRFGNTHCSLFFPILLHESF